MAIRPFSPWRQGEALTPQDQLELESRPHSTLEAIGYRGFADLYRVLRSIGITPPVAKQMELWEIAAVMGADIEKPEDDWQPTEKDLERMRSASVGGDITQSALGMLGVRPRN